MFFIYLSIYYFFLYRNFLAKQAFLFIIYLFYFHFKGTRTIQITIILFFIKSHFFFVLLIHLNNLLNFYLFNVI